MTKQTTFHGRRKGRPLRKARQSAMDHHLDPVSISPDLDGIHHPQNFFDQDYKKFHLEIGFGNGEHVLENAKRNPDIGYIGCEPFENGVSVLVDAIREENIKNIRIWVNPINGFLPQLQDACLSGCDLLFSDPWPKRRHYKRRVVQFDLLDDLARVLKPDAPLFIATDNPDLAAWSLYHIQNHDSFDWSAKNHTDWARPNDMPATKYEQQLNRHGVTGRVYLRFIRI